MKKLLFLSVLALFALVSANVFGQAGLTPHSGATHTYWVNANASGTTQTSGIGSTYTWEVLRTGGSAAASTDYQFVGASSGLNQFSVQIKWLSPAVADGNPYFLVLTETNTSCSNKKVVQIDPENAFAVVIQNVDAALADLGAGKEWCAPDITLNLADANIVYNYGTTTLYYRVDAQGLAADWSFNYKFTETGKDANSTITAFWGDDAASATNALTYSTTGGAINVLGGAQDIVIKVVIDNSTVAEGETADHNIILTLSGFSDGSNAPISINGASVPPNTADIDQTVKKRPATTGISSN
jgi:hypothetical protein